MFILTFVTFVYNRRFMISVKHKSRSLRFNEYLVVVKKLQPLRPGVYEIHHAGGSGGLSFSSTGQVKVMIDGGHQSFHRDEITEHKRPGYYTVRRGGKKYNIKYNQFEIDEVEVVSQVINLITL